MITCLCIVGPLARLLLWSYAAPSHYLTQRLMGMVCRLQKKYLAPHGMMYIPCF
jgi:hypothetical protein